MVRKEERLMAKDDLIEIENICRLGVKKVNGRMIEGHKSERREGFMMVDHSIQG